MGPALLLLTDSRLPAGGHAHSGGAEQAIASGAVHDVPSLAAFLRGRLHTAGTVTAAFAAAACTHAASPPQPTTPEPATPVDAAPGPATTVDAAPGPGPFAVAGPGPMSWVVLDAEVDARTAAPAQREASRTQGRLLLRVARRVWPSPILGDLSRTVPNPHHPIALGAAAHAAGATPEEAAMAAAYHAVSGPATAAVRLLGLDPVAVHGLLADLTPDLTAVAARAHLAAAGQAPESLPAHSAPALDLLAERHARTKIRLFVS
ncbi:urease accessory UreF family protein [Nonomuraea sp. NPDC046802]|uniref:urease accessory protein UreF n=1 Tax=Nonomuraea sp. NPDC046802 TaxID=3154919 RepID=UPI0033F431D1